MLGNTNQTYLDFQITFPITNSLTSSINVAIANFLFVEDYEEETVVLLPSES